VEAFGDFDILTQDLIDRRALSVIEVPAKPRWADMSNLSLLSSWKLDARISVGDYEVCQLWAQALFSVGFTGVYYQPRHFVGPDWPPSVALFSDPGHQPTQLQALETTAIPSQLVIDAETTFGLTIWPSVALPPPRWG
jgi:hypothetical protein